MTIWDKGIDKASGHWYPARFIKQDFLNMEKQKRWQFFLILAVVFLTIYNILPTVFFYSKPLRKPVGQKEAGKVASGAIARINRLEPFTLSWLKAQSKNLGLKPTEIALNSEDPRLATISFKKPEEAALFAQTLERSGALIPFVPAQLSPGPRSFEEGATTVTVQRRIGVHLDSKQPDTYFHFVPKITDDGEVSPLYRELVSDRAALIASRLGGTSEPAKTLATIAADPSDKGQNEGAIRLARQIVEYENTFGDNSSITKRFFSSFNTPSQNLIPSYISRLELINQQLSSGIKSLNEIKEKGEFLDSAQQQKLEVFENQKNIIDSAILIIKRNSSAFQSTEAPLTHDQILTSLVSSADKVQSTVDLGDRNPFVEKLSIDWEKDTIELILYPEIATLRNQAASSESAALTSEKLNQLLFNEIASTARFSDETITPTQSNFIVQLNELTNSSSLLALDIGALASLEANTIKNLLETSWTPSEGELATEDYPILEHKEFDQLPAEKQKLGLVIYAPAMDEKTQEGFRSGSIYIIAKGLNTMVKKYRDGAPGSDKDRFESDFRSLQEILRQNGFIGYAASVSNMPEKYRNDYIFELDDYYSYLIAATREDFSVKGSKRVATLEFTDVEQRLLTLNKIQTREHEDLLKWKDEYQSAQVSLLPNAKYDVPKPTKSVLRDNLRLSFAKYFRGDDRKILRWGLDLSGGKTVRIGLKDRNNQTITEEADLKQAVNELYQRVNKLGVSEVSIRTEGSTIVLDFPGSQGLSAAELIQASAMYFHVVNEKFTANNAMLAEAVNTFLEEVWNEAVITNRTDPENLNDIAWQHLGGNPENPGEFQPLTSHAKLLYENGLRLASPRGVHRSSTFDDTLSSIAVYRGSDFADWYGQTYPLLIVFHNYALEGSDLSDVQTGYDPSEGNLIHFSVKGSHIGREGEKINPRDEFYNWTSEFSEEKIAGTPKETFSQGRGWRMAVILNGSIINAPTLNAALRESARISGHFSQREVNQLSADLKAGSLSFTPHILSEENVSPDLGKEQRTQGILAAAIGLLFVIIIMCSYYRFGGVIASIAVLFNLLIMWAVLQNMGAALTLPGIAGIILTVGMSVDANVLVFERIREEFAISKRLPSAIQAGYRKAFSAIIDSNLTTVIAAIILLNFNSGPIKGFALTLIIGIASSMFTSLFVTRYFFAGWVQNPKHKQLKMAQFFGQTNFDFLKKAKIAFTGAALFIIVGLYFFVTEQQTIYGMDFTGGYSLSINLQEKADTNYRLVAANALESAGAGSSDFMIQELNKPNQLRIQLGITMEQPNKPFYQLDESDSTGKPLYTYQEYPRIVWIIDALADSGLQLNPTSLPNLHLHWTSMSGQLSDSMRNAALIGLSVALLAILIYITFRFEFKYAVSATVALAHDLLITLGILSIVHYFYEGLQIDLQVIAALMTIVGYSLNDTIVIFDRIREDIRILRKMTFSQIINHGLNCTLSRTVMTSSTTLFALVALTVLGGKSIFTFALIMSLGVIIGTFSSLFIAAPVLLMLHNREEAKEKKSLELVQK